MKRQLAALLVVFHLVGLWSAPAQAVPVAPIVYAAFRIGTQSYAVSKLAELGQSLLGQTIKQLDLSLAPITGVGGQIATGVRVPTTVAEPVPAPDAPLTSPQTYKYNVTTNVCPNYNPSSGGCSTSSTDCTATSCTVQNQLFCPTGVNCWAQWNGCTAVISGGTMYGPFYICTYPSQVAPNYIGCANGYTFTNNECHLTNPRVASPDDFSDQKRTGETFSTYDGEAPSEFDAFLSRSTVSVNNDKITINGRDETSSQPQTVSVRNTSDGGSVLQVATQKTDSLGRTYTEVKDVVISPSGVVSSVQASQQATYNTWNSSTNTYTSSATATSTYTPVTSSGEIVFPSDYAKAGEAAAAAASINANLGPKLDKITETGADPTDPILPGDAEWTPVFFNGTFTNLLGWSMPSHSSQCPTGSFAWNNSTYTIDSHCQLVNNHFSLFSVVMVVIWTIGALFILLAA